MRHNFFVGLLCLGVFQLSGCKQSPEDQVETLPEESSEATIAEEKAVQPKPPQLIANDYGSNSTEASLKDEVTYEVAEYSRDGDLVGAVTLIAKGGEILDLQAHGIKNLETTEPVQTDSLFKIYSFTKSITCAAALMLYEQGKFEFDDPVSDYLPVFEELTIEAKEEGGEPTPATSPMLIKHLFTHTSGLSYKHADELFELKSLDEVISGLAAKPIAFEPGTDWEYGMSIDVIGKLIEIWSGEKYEVYIREKLLNPLGMINTAFYISEADMARKVTVYKSEKAETNDFQPDEEDNEIPTKQPGFCMPGGGLYSTAVDYYKFINMILNQGAVDGKRYLKPESIKLMTSNQVPESVGWVKFGDEIRDGFGFGYGFNVVTQPSEFDPDAKVGECGWGGKASCHYWFDPKSKVAVITLEQIIPYRWSLERVLKPFVYKKFE